MKRGDWNAMIWLKKTYLKHNPDPFADLREELEEEMNKLDKPKRKRIREINKDFENPIAEDFD